MCVTPPRAAAAVQASHHGLQAAAGLVAQLRAGQSLQVWEHGVLHRERLIYRAFFFVCIGGREEGGRVLQAEHARLVQFQTGIKQIKQHQRYSRLLQAHAAAADAQRAAHAPAPRGRPGG
jgi:hypothetical protein